MKKFLYLFTVILPLALSGCSDGYNSQEKNITQDQLKEYFSKHRVGSSPDYAVVKNGNDYLLTVHSYSDDKATCEEIIKPYNEDPNLSVVKGSYECVRLND